MVVEIDVEVGGGVITGVVTGMIAGDIAGVEKAGPRLRVVAGQGGGEVVVLDIEIKVMEVVL